MDILSGGFVTMTHNSPLYETFVKKVNSFSVLFIF